jgi:hypothetical protein
MAAAPDRTRTEGLAVRGALRIDRRSGVDLQPEGGTDLVSPLPGGSPAKTAVLAGDPGRSNAVMQ